MTKKKSKICEYCKKEYLTSHPESRFCSKSCASKSRFKEDKHIFEENLNKNSAYLLGLIYADGCLIYDKHSKRYKVNITLKDRELIDKIAKIINTKHSIYKNRSCYSIYYFNEKSIWNLINLYGLVQRKSNILTWPNNLTKELYSDFIRGYFDGDGSIIQYRVKEYFYVKISITSGSKKFLDEMQKVLKNEIDINVHINKDVRKNTYYLQINKKKDVKKFLDYI